MPDSLYTAPEYNPNHDEKWLEELSIPQSIQFMIDILPTIRRLLKKWPKYKTLKILDVGTATGAGANLLAILHRSRTPVKMEVDCLDLSDVYQNYAKEHFKDVNYIVGDIFSIEKDRKWDLVICSHLIEHFKDPTNFILELKRRSRFYTVFYTPFEEKNLSRGHHISFDYKKINEFKPESIEVIESPAWVHPVDKESKCVVFVLKGDENLPQTLNDNEYYEIKQIKFEIDNNKNFDESLIKMKQLLKKYPNDAELNYLAGVCHHNKKELKSALECYTKAIENGFREFWVWRNRGNVFRVMGNFDKAYSDFEQAIALKPYNEEVKASLNFLKNELK